MPRYFFNLFNDVTVHDEEGIELADGDSALAMGISSARHMAADSVLKGHLTLNHRIEVMDSSGKCIGTVRFGDVVEVRNTD